MMDETMISQKDANSIIRKEIRTMMKQSGFLKAHRSGLFFREKDGFLQSITLGFYRAFPEIKAYIFPTFLYVNGNTPYIEADMIQIQFDEMGENIPFDLPFFIKFKPDPCYYMEQFNEVWSNNKKLLQEYLIPCLDSLDFEKTLALFKEKKTNYFCSHWSVDYALDCAYAVGLLKSGVYEEALEGLKKSREIYAKKVELLGEDNKDIFLFKNNLEYIDDLLYQLQNQPNDWKENIASRIERATDDTLQMWSTK